MRRFAFFSNPAAERSSYNVARKSASSVGHEKANFIYEQRLKRNGSATTTVAGDDLRAFSRTSIAYA